MAFYYILFTGIGVFLFLLGISVGHSIFVLKLRKEENRKRELELAILNKRSQVIKDSKRISDNLEELLYKANVQHEIDNIIRRNETN